ncbi:hypothetical protein ACVWW1_007968 [Bradyrhizobium sp. JR3.5]
MIGTACQPTPAELIDGRRQSERSRMPENAEQRCAEGAEHMQECCRIGRQPPAAAAELIESLQHWVD